MPEIKTDDQDKLIAWQKENNMEVLNLAQISAILMQHEEILRDVVDVLKVITKK